MFLNEVKNNLITINKMSGVFLFEGGFNPQPRRNISGGMFKRKRVIDESLIAVKSFMMGPDKQAKNGYINNLKNNLGIIEGGVRTFKTSFISGNKSVKYNGYDLQLVVKDGVVFLSVSLDGQTFMFDCWNINSVVDGLSQRNNKCDFFDAVYVEDLINKGRLSVKFNVSKLKNHGTTWKMV